MKLSQHEQQVLVEIQQGVRAQDPEFFASMAGFQSRRGGSVWGSVMLTIGLAAFVFAAIVAQVMPDVGFFVSLAALMTIFWGLSLFSQMGDRGQRVSSTTQQPSSAGSGRARSVPSPAG